MGTKHHFLFPASSLPLPQDAAGTGPRFALHVPPAPSLLQPSPAALASGFFKPAKAGLPAPSLHTLSPTSETFFLSTMGQQFLLQP